MFGSVLGYLKQLNLLYLKLILNSRQSVAVKFGTNILTPMADEERMSPLGDFSSWGQWFEFLSML